MIDLGLARELGYSFVDKLDSGHDRNHLDMVFRYSTYIGEREGADLEIVGAAAYLHEHGDPKFSPDPKRALEQAIGVLGSGGATLSESGRILRIAEAVEDIGFSKGRTPRTIESMVLQDADYLTAMGAVGIGRTFMYSGAKGRGIFTPEGTRQHFDDKLLLLKDRMHTATGRRLAESRHRILVDFVRELDRERSGEFLLD